ncbi:hypothetical protein [Saccharothrix sp. HUAS TT1]|uniref:hypothetical protein n=1 Tax=unclassified Saccharothrix TaxID=2593673 RepID=UPI00345C3EBA
MSILDVGDNEANHQTVPPCGETGIRRTQAARPHKSCMNVAEPTAPPGERPQSGLEFTHEVKPCRLIALHLVSALVTAGELTGANCPGEIPGLPRTPNADANCPSANSPGNSSRTRIPGVPFGNAALATTAVCSGTSGVPDPGDPCGALVVGVISRVGAASTR